MHPTLPQPPVISNHLRGLVSDTAGIDVPPAYDRLETIAAASVLARGLALGREPDRHDYISAVQAYLLSLPKDIAAAKVVISRDASSVLGVPGLAADRTEIEAARQVMRAAETALLEAQSQEGLRLGRISRIEADLVSLNAESEKWNRDFPAETASHESAILEYFGNQDCDGRLSEISRLAILQRLAPKAIAGINKRLSELSAELDQLRGKEKTSRKSAPAELTL